MEKQEDIFLPDFKERRMDIFDRQFNAIFDDPIYDPTKMTIIQGTDGVLDDLFSYQVYNKLKNNWRGAVAPTDMQDGMIYSDTDDGKLHHRHGAALEEVLQLTRSSDVTPTFLGLLLAEYITHVGDPDTYIRFQVDHMTLRVGDVDFIDAVEAATDYLELLAGLNFIGGGSFSVAHVNTKMTQGLTIGQGGNDDEILAFKSSDVAHGVTDHAETDTYGNIEKFSGDSGGMRLRGYSEDVVSASLEGVATNDNTTKSTAGLGVVELIARKKSGTGYGNVGADANIVVMRNHTTTRWILDEDGDTWQQGEITCASLSSLVLGTPIELTIAGGTITVTRSYHKVDGQGDAADNLDDINDGVVGMVLVLTAENVARAITVRHGAGNIQLDGNANFVMNTQDNLTLIYDGANWTEISRSNN